MNLIKQLANENPLWGAPRIDPVLIGAWAPNTPFKGIIDDVRIYNRALTASEVVMLFGER